MPFWRRVVFPDMFLLATSAAVPATEMPLKAVPASTSPHASVQTQADSQLGQGPFFNREQEKPDTQTTF